MRRPYVSRLTPLLGAAILLFSLAAYSIGCGPIQGALGIGPSSTQPSLTHGQMVKLATEQEIGFTIIESGLNDAFANGWLTASEHATLDPYIKAGRKGVDQLTADAQNLSVTPDTFNAALRELAAVLQPLNDAQVRANAVKVTKARAAPTTRPAR